MTNKLMQITYFWVIFCFSSTISLANELTFSLEYSFAQRDTFIEESIKSRKKNKSKKGGDKTADKLYERYGYMASTELYETLESKGELTLEMMQRVANGYRLNSKFYDAAFWYDRLIGQTDDPTDYLHYAQVLQANGKCEDAIRWYKMYDENTKDKNRSYILDCDELKEFTKNENIEVENIEALNTKHIDYSPIPYKNGIVFTSTRGGENGTKKSIDIWTQDNFADLYYADKADGGSFKEVRSLRGSINGQYHDGVATFDRSGSTMYFSRNNIKGKSKDKTKDLKIYKAIKEGEAWSSPEELPNINSDEFATCHPTLSADGRRLYFASSRPGGYGGMDIWVSVKTGDSWREPSNLGPTVNSSGNDIFPYISPDNELYYASDGHRGLGGLDIFVATQEEEGEDDTWNQRENLGYQYNTNKDDFGFYISEDKEWGYLTSNRIGGLGEDDIYRWESTEPKKKKETATDKQFCVVDANTGALINTAKVVVMESSEEWVYTDMMSSGAIATMENEAGEIIPAVTFNNNKVAAHASYETDEEGQFETTYKNEKVYAFIIEKTGYKPKRLTMTTEQIKNSESDCITIELIPSVCLNLEGKVKNKNMPKYIPNAAVMILNKCNGEIEEAFTDENGGFELCLECDCEYVIVAKKRFFFEASAEISTVGMPCNEPGVVNALIELEFGGPETEGELSAEALNTYFTGGENPDYSVGQIITLRNIYYDFDKYYIREDASKELSYLVSLMQNYPSLEISLRSHTDSRGTFNYNKWLSRKRANAAREFLIKYGISASRIHSYKGFGEDELANYCADGVECTEYEHQQNRRTEIVIEQFDEPNVQIQKDTDKY